MEGGVDNNPIISNQSKTGMVATSDDGGTSQTFRIGDEMRVGIRGGKRYMTSDGHAHVNVARSS